MFFSPKTTNEKLIHVYDNLVMINISKPEE